MRNGRTADHDQIERKKIIFLYKDNYTLEQFPQRLLAESVLGGFQDPTGQSHEKSVLNCADLDLSKRLTELETFQELLQNE